MKPADNHTDLVGLMNQAPRCMARTRRGTPCQCPAIRGRKRCRLHGGASPGAPRGERHGRWVDGRYSIEAKEENRRFREFFRILRESLADL